MASAKYVKAMASGIIRLQKAPRVGGEVMLVFRPLYNKTTGKPDTPKSITVGTSAVEPMLRSDVTLDNLRHSNLEHLIRRQAVRLLDV